MSELVNKRRSSKSTILMLHQWAWQNTHVTLHIPADQRITTTRKATRFNVRKGRDETKVYKVPRQFTLKDSLSNLHLLLRVKSFASWPLELHFYAKDVYDAWKKHIKKLNPPINNKRKIFLHFEQAPPKNNLAAGVEIIHGTLQDLDIGYGRHKAYLEKSVARLTADTSLLCAICSCRLSQDNDLLVVCPATTCTMVAHVTCLAQKFCSLEAALIPTSGSCPSCNSDIDWNGLAKNLSLRLRGAREVAQLTEKQNRRSRKVKSLDITGKTANENMHNEYDDDHSNESDEEDILNRAFAYQEEGGGEHEVGGESEIDDGKIAPTSPKQPHPNPKNFGPKPVPILSRPTMTSDIGRTYQIILDSESDGEGNLEA